MADVETLRERAATCRKVAERRTTRGRVVSNAYLIGLADHYEEQADAVEASATAGNKPSVRPVLRGSRA
jgi:hypothetical protein